ELRPVSGLPTIIVDKRSATAGCTRSESQGIDEDHFNIVKPIDQRHATHQWIVAEIQKPATKPGWELDRWTKNEVIVGSKNYLESHIHAAMIALVIQEKYPVLKVRTQYNMGHGSRLHWALRDEMIDIYPEYDGSLLQEYLHKEPNVERLNVDVDTINRELQ